MPHPHLDRSQLEFLPVRDRDSKFGIEDIAVDPDATPDDPGEAGDAIAKLADRIVSSRDRGAPIVICHGAHLIKNGLAPLLIRMVEEGWLQHIATNGAGSIHDWEFGYFGRSCEDVKAYVAQGQFGIWDETGGTIGLSILIGALDGCGYGESVGRTMVEGKIVVPSREELEAKLSDSETRAAAADVLDALDAGSIESGERTLPHSHLPYSVQAACYKAGVPFTVHPGIGQDIIYTHPLFVGGAVGRTSMNDFLTYADAVSRLSGGVYISAGSSVMSPMIFEKSVSMARNLERRGGRGLSDFVIAVNDLAESTWDWSQGEPPIDHPAYYVRFCKSFSRMGGELSYYGLDNRVFLTNLYAHLKGR
ncbi:MAG: hypothetical protein AAF517_09090 [Planctomycetota bacterium]